MKSVSVLYILEDGRFGGMNKMTADIAKRITQMGYDTHIIVGNHQSDFFIQYLSQNFISYTTLPLRVLSRKSAALIWYTLKFIPEIVVLYRNIKKENPAIVYCNGSQQIKGVIAASLAGRTVVWHMHDTFQPRPLLILFNAVRRICHIKWFVASSQKTIDFYSLDPSQTLISRPPIDTSFFNNRKTVSIQAKTRVIRMLTIANINTDKGIDTLIRTAAQLQNYNRQFLFTVVGLGAQEDNPTFREAMSLIKALAINNVVFVGQKEDVRTLLTETDLYLCTSRNESGPISVFEALSMGVPVISTAVGDLPALFSKYHYGPTCRIGDYRALADEVYRLVSHPDEMQQRAAIGRTIAEQELDITICVAGQRDFYNIVYTHGQ